MKTKNRLALGVVCLQAALGFLSSAPLAKADDCKACDRYLSFVPQYSLATNVGLIGTAALHPEGNQFNVDAELADALTRQVKEDTRIPDECRDYVLSTIKVSPRLEVVASGGVGAKPPGFSMASDYPANLMGVFNNFLASSNPCTSLRAQGGTAYTNCLQLNGPAAYNKFSKNLAGSTNQQIIAQLAATGYTASNNDVTLLKAYNAAINSGSSAGLMAWAKGAGKSLSTDQFLTAVQMVGWQMNNTYNYARADQVGKAGQGIVTVDQAMSSLKTDTMYMIQGYNDPAKSIADYAVICRDAAVVQAQMLQAGGFKNSYEVSYRADTGGHVDVITQDPNNASKLYLLNWYGRSTRDGLDGGQALFEGSGMGIPDYSMNYIVSAPDGRNVADVPSEMGKFLTEAAGGNITSWDPLARSTSSIMAVSGSPDNKGLLQLRALYGTDGNGATYEGAAVSGHWGVGTNFPGQAGIVGAQQERPMDVYGTNANGTDLVGYVQAEQHVLTNKVQLAPGVTGVLDTHLTVGGMVTQITSGPDYKPGGSNTNGEYDQRIGTEVRIDQTADDGKLKAQYVAGATAMLGQSDVRDADPGSYTIVPLGGYLGARATLDTGPITLVGQAMVAVDQLGVRDKVEVGVASRRISATVFESGRVDDNTALVQDNSLRRVGVSITANPNNWLRLGLTGEVPIEGDDAASGARVYGTAAVVF